MQKILEAQLRMMTQEINAKACGNAPQSGCGMFAVGVVGVLGSMCRMHARTSCMGCVLWVCAGNRLVKIRSDMCNNKD